MLQKKVRITWLQSQSDQAATNRGKNLHYQLGKNTAKNMI